jgi:hypothetical protein
VEHPRAIFPQTYHNRRTRLLASFFWPRLKIDRPSFFSISCPIPTTLFVGLANRGDCPREEIEESIMAKYLFIYRNEPMPVQPSPEEMQAALAEWGVWVEKFMKSGNILDPGDGLKECGKVLRMAGTAVTDGPYVEAKEILGGYSVVQADSYDAAVTIAKECPGAKYGTLEIRELAGYV